MILKKLFESIKHQKGLTFNDNNEESIIYKGFKIIKCKNEYSIKDVRFNDFYSKIKIQDARVIIKYNSLIKGIDHITFERDKIKYEKLKTIIGGLYDLRKQVSMGDYDPPYKLKKLNNINKNLDKNRDLLFLYDTRIKHHKYKYKNE